MAAAVSIQSSAERFSVGDNAAQIKASEAKDARFMPYPLPTCEHIEAIRQLKRAAINRQKGNYRF
jgi:hypothetical protein